MPSPPKPTRAQLVAATGAALVLVLGTPMLSAQADPVYPSAGEVAAAKSAAGDKAAQVAAVEAHLMASNARLVEVQTAAEVANENYNLPQILMISIPASLSGVLLAALWSMRRGKDLDDDPEFQARIADPEQYAYV